MKEVEKVLRSLKRGEWVRIVWLDAATISKIPKDTDPSEVPIITVAETVGRYVGIFKDRKVRVPHLVIVTEASGDNETWTSIPLVLVRKIVKLVEKEALKSLRFFGGAGCYKSIARILMRLASNGEVSFEEKAED